MSLEKTGAAVALLLGGVLSVYLSLGLGAYGTANFCVDVVSCQSGVLFGASTWLGTLTPVVGGLAVVVALLALWGARLAFLAGAVVGALLAAITMVGLILGLAGESAYRFPNGALGTEAAAVVMAVVGTGFCILVARRAGSIPEEANPLNLPVFG